jgi:SAM-dependent MidA family methyltransferase
VTGSVVAFDYGVRATEELVGRDWLRTYRGHSRGVFNFEQSFECDVTADVAFDQLPAPQSLSTQRDWLIQHGIDGLVEAGRRIWQERAHLGDLAAIRGRSRSVEADALCDMNGLGAFLVAEWSGEAKESAVP